MSLVHRAVRRRSLSTALAVSLAAAGDPAQAAPSRRRRVTAPPGSPRQLDRGPDPQPTVRRFDDYGLTIDTAFALEAIGGHGTDVQQIRTRSPSTSTTTRPASTSAPTRLRRRDRQAARRWPRTRARDPRTSAASTWSSAWTAGSATCGPTEGRIAGQVHASATSPTPSARSSRSAASPRPEPAGRPAAKFLLQQQCARGLLPAELRRKAARPSRAAREEQTRARPRRHRVRRGRAVEVRARATRSSARPSSAPPRWLQAPRSASNGSFGGGPAPSAANTNSTGLAGWALAADGPVRRRREGRRAGSPSSRSAAMSGTPLAGERGAIAYDRAAHEGRQARRHHRRDAGPVASGHRPGGAGAAAFRARLTASCCGPSSASPPRPSWPRRRGSVLSAAGAGGDRAAPRHGVSVVVDFHELGGGVQTVCDAGRGGQDAATPSSRTSGHTLTYVQREPGFVCQVDGASRPTTRASTPRPRTPTGRCGGPTASPARGPTPRRRAAR